jgi:hypothetical protein
MFFMDASGNIGIGTSVTNGNKLSVNGATAITGSVLPGSSNTYDLGSSSKNWSAVYASTGSFGDVSISGNLTVAGTQTIINTDVLSIKDNAILVNAAPSPLSTGGIYVADTTALTTGSLIWDTTTDTWKAGKLGSETTLVSGSGTTNYVTKWAGTSSLSTGVLYDDATNVGISTASPSAKFHVYNTSNIISLVAQSGSLGTSVGAGLAYNGGDISSFQYSNGNTSILKIKGVRHTAVADWTGASTRIQQVIDSTNMAYIDFNPVGGTGALSLGTGIGPTEALRIDSSQNVGIGTSTYSARLFVSGSPSTTTPTMIVKEGVVTPTAGVGTFDVQNSAGTSLLFVSGSGGVGIGTNSILSPIKLYVSSSQTGTAAAALIIGQLFGSSINTYKCQNHIFQLADTTEAMRINSTGVGIGTGTYTARLFVSGSSTASTPTMIVKEGVVSPTGGVGVFNVQNSAGTSLLFVSGSGDVGIGTAPYDGGSSLTVYRSNKDANVLTYGVGTKDGNNVASGYYFATYSASGPVVRAGSLSVTPSGNTELSYSTNESGKSLRFLTGGSSSTPVVAMTITAENGVAGKIGIGTTSPSGNLQLESGEAWFKTTADTSSYTHLNYGAAGDNYISSGNDSFITVGQTTIRGKSVGGAQTDIAYFTVAGTSPRVGIGTAALSYYLKLGADSAAKPSTNTWTVASDMRLKENIETIKNPLERILQLRGVEFDWKPGLYGVDVVHDGGFIAQELEESFPHWVRESETSEEEKSYIPSGMKKDFAMRNDFYALTVESFRALKEENDLLKSENEEIKKLISDLQNQVTDLVEAIGGK